ncbi:hypothetical protein [Rhodococcus sp. SGAir0479]|uniref:hypothetical protein n=1 Tax=Rhodococcus sp. SGAir0479 TaxID=2567884 RepID=UPI0010CCBEC0|nr:hypothetical protein [Rhodococcus sp. SGAir0479]QCQ91731.1 hypothetical protein E7742_11140 [Rhodococcus sp. SGAir0479]
MSNHANPQNAYAWMDGDAFRAPAGTKIPSNAFKLTGTELPLTAAITGPPAIPAVTWPAFGGVEAGIQKSPSQNLTKLHAANYRDAPYKILRDPREEVLKFKAYDYSRASVQTALQGGSITESSAGSGIYVWDVADDEEFAFLWISKQRSDGIGYYCERMTLGTPVASAIADGKSIDAFDFELHALAPVKRLRTEDDLAGTP